MTVSPLGQAGIALGVDIGGSGARAGVVDLLNGTLHGPLAQVDMSPKMTSTRIIRALTMLIATTGAAAGVPVGIGVPGFVDEAGASFFCVNMPGLNGLDLPAALGRAGRTVPDLAAWAAAEARFGASRSARRGLTVAVGSGVNAQLTVDGKFVVTAAGCNGAELRRIGVPYLVERVTIVPISVSATVPVVGAALLAT